MFYDFLSAPKYGFFKFILTIYACFSRALGLYTAGFSSNLTILFTHYAERRVDGATHPHIPKTLNDQATSHMQKVQVRRIEKESTMKFQLSQAQNVSPSGVWGQGFKLPLDF